MEKKKAFPWNGETLMSQFGDPVEVFGWRDSVTIDSIDEAWESRLSLTIEGARALAAQLIAAAEYADGVSNA